MIRTMKTATVTWTTYNNYGTVLQAYALQQELLKLGHENVILSDGKIIAEQIARNKAAGWRAASTPRQQKGKCSVLRRAARVLINPRKTERVLTARLDRSKYEQPYYASQEAIERFKRESLILDQDMSPDALDKVNERYDAFIAGSDQVWSVFERTFNPFYYLDFAGGRKISYAPSLGTDQIPESMRKTIQALLSDFHAVSAREMVSAQQLAEITGKDVAWVVDPTILRGRDNWTEDTRGVKKPTRRRYLLCYFLENNPWYFEQARRVAKQLHLRPVLIPSRWDHVNSEFVIRDAVGPLEFVTLFQNADFVMTDSYHGSIFSILFEKSFQYLERFGEQDPHSQSMRIHSLFDAIGISDLIVPQGRDAVHDPEISWPEVRKKLEALRRESEAYLINSLS